MNPPESRLTQKRANIKSGVRDDGLFVDGHSIRPVKPITVTTILQQTLKVDPAASLASHHRDLYHLWVVAQVMDDEALPQDDQLAQQYHQPIVTASFHLDHQVHARANALAYHVADDDEATVRDRLGVMVLVDCAAMAQVEAMDLVEVNVLVVVIVQIALTAVVLIYQVGPSLLETMALVVVLVLSPVDHNLDH